MTWLNRRKDVGAGLLFGILAICFIVSQTPAGMRQLAEEEDLSTDAKAAADLDNFKIEWTPFTYFTFFCIALSLIIASASGIGGGGVLVPLYILMLGAPGKVAIPLSNVTILGGGIGNNIFNIPKRHWIKDRPLIDYDTVLMLEPMTIFGAVLGSFANKVLPDFVLIILLASSLALTASHTLKKGLKSWEKETLAMEAGGAASGGAGSKDSVKAKRAADNKGDFTALGTEDDDEDDEDGPDEEDGSLEMTAEPSSNGSTSTAGAPPSNGEGEQDDEETYSSLPDPQEGQLEGGGGNGEESQREPVVEAKKKKKTTPGNGDSASEISATMSEQEVKDAALAIIEEEERHHPLGKIAFLVSCFAGVMVLDFLKDTNECGTPPFWLYTFLTVPWSFAYTLVYGRYLVKRYELKLKVGYEFVEGDVLWDHRATLLYPVLCTGAGILAGLFGVGGGMIKGPLVLEMGLTPLQAHATGMFMIIFTSGSACVAFYLFGQINFDAAAVLFPMGLVCTALGQFGFDKLMKRLHRQSIIVLLMGTVITMSAILLTAQALIDAKHRVDQGEGDSLYSFGTLCGIGKGVSSGESQDEEELDGSGASP